jgi:hypothetical protein
VLVQIQLRVPFYGQVTGIEYLVRSKRTVCECKSHLGYGGCGLEVQAAVSKAA